MKTKEKSIKLRSSVLALAVLIAIGIIAARNSAGSAGLAATAQSTAKLTVIMKVSISCQCQDRNHVGNEWGQDFNIDGIAVKNGSRITLEAGQTIVICSEVVEYDDGSDDTAQCQNSVQITTELVKTGFSVTQTVRVKENGGRYKGNIAVWTVVYTFTPQ